MTHDGGGSIHNLCATEFHTNVQGALADVELRGALAKGTSTVQNRRDTAAASVPEWEDLRTRAAELKAHTLGTLAEQLELFEANATAHGAVVHWANTAEEARSIITSLAKNAGGRIAVKSKSMTSEEIGLNEALLEAGTTPIETDLGEWIVQLAGETPSHIVAPALHKSRAAIRRLFEEVFAREMPEDAEGLTEFARLELRRSFATADVGISGANFLIAETGSLLILENEGNIRLTTSMPRTHIALVGIEKVIPRVEDLDVFLRLIGRSGTGQALTVYQSLITGTKHQPEDDGPEALHIVLLDNGRSELLRDEATAHTLACIRCGACLNTCPVYRQIGGHAYGSVYPGPIGAILTPLLAGHSSARELPFASTLCGACRDVCPVKIDIPKVLLHLREEIVAHAPATPTSTRKRRAFEWWAWAMTSSRRYAFVGLVARCGVRVAQTLSVVRSIGPLRGWTAGRHVPPAPPKSLRRLMRERERSR